jgi:hypothetical protein
MLELNIIRYNLNTFYNLQPYDQIRINIDNSLDVDKRWFKSVRRYYDGSSRNLLVSKLDYTFNSLLSYNEYCDDNNKYINDCLDNLKYVISITYPNFVDLNVLIEKFISIFKKSDIFDVDVDINSDSDDDKTIDNENENENDGDSDNEKGKCFKFLNIIKKCFD